MGVEYVVRGAFMSCPFGSCLRKINLPVSHGSYIKKDPVMTKKDTATELNVGSFGICTKLQAPCVPSLPGEWDNTKDDNLINGEPALTVESKVTCFFGGTIVFVTSGQK